MAFHAELSFGLGMPMICSSVNLVRFIVRPQVGPDSNRTWRKNPVAGHRHARRPAKICVGLPTEFVSFGYTRG